MNQQISRQIIQHNKIVSDGVKNVWGGGCAAIKWKWENEPWDEGTRSFIVSQHIYKHKWLTYTYPHWLAGYPGCYGTTVVINYVGCHFHPVDAQMEYLRTRFGIFGLSGAQLHSGTYNNVATLAKGVIYCDILPSTHAGCTWPHLLLKYTILSFYQTLHLDPTRIIISTDKNKKEFWLCNCISNNYWHKYSKN